MSATDHEKEITKLNGKVNYLEADNIVLKSEMLNVRALNEELLYNQKICEVELVGLGDYPVVKLRDMVENFVKKNKIGINTNDIKQLEKIVIKNKKSNIVRITFGSKEKRTEFLKNARNLKPTAMDFGGNANSKVFVNESIPAYTRKLLYTTRMIKVTENWKYVWIYNGKVHVKRSESDAPIRIMCDNDLEIL